MDDIHGNADLERMSVDRFCQSGRLGLFGVERERDVKDWFWTGRYPLGRLYTAFECDGMTYADGKKTNEELR